MTDKEYKTIKRLACKYFDVWRLRMGLRHWDLTLLMSRTECPDSRETAGRCDCMWEYKSATITIYAPRFLNAPESKMLRIIIHEFCHVLVREMREWGDPGMDDKTAINKVAHEERVVTNLTDAFIWTYEDGVAAGKKGKNDIG